MAVLFAKEPSEHEVVCDLHDGMTNLALVVRNERWAAELFDRLQRVLYSDEVYLESKRWLSLNEDGKAPIAIGLIEKDDGSVASVDLAYHYFIASWMGRNGVAGTARVNYQIATRWTKGGGSGPLRFRNAVDSIPAWCERLRNVHILRRDLFKVLPKIEDAPGMAVYVDPPYLPGTVSSNSRYLHDFPPDAHARLATELRRFKLARVVVSYYASDQLTELYPGWTVLDFSRQKHLHVQNQRGIGKGMTTAPEVLLVNGEPYATDRPDRPTLW